MDDTHMPLTFREATDLLFRTVTANDLAERLGVSRNTIARARMDSDNPNSRPAPPGWQDAVRELARERGAALLDLAKRI